MIGRFLGRALFFVLAAALAVILLLDLLFREVSRLFSGPGQRPLIVTGAALFLVLAAVLFYRAVLGRRAQQRRRVRAIRWRVRLRLQPGAGYASLAELVFRWGRLAALFHGGRMRPDLGFWARLFLPTTHYAVRLGRAWYGRRVYARGEDQPWSWLRSAPARAACSRTGYSATGARCWPRRRAGTCSRSRPRPGPGGARWRSSTRRGSRGSCPPSPGTLSSPAVTW